MHEIELKTDRLLLRQWRDADLPQLSAMNRDLRVMEFVGPALSEDQSKTMMERSRQSWNERGYGRFAVEVPGVAEVIGFIGLAVPRFESQGAESVMDHAIKVLGLTEIVSFTTATNFRSRRVMEKIGLRRDPLDDFEHPNIPSDDPLRACVLYH